MTEIQVPTSRDQLTREWFNSFLDEEVLSAKELRVIHGTATKFQMALQLACRDGATETRTVWVKTGMESVNNEIKDHAKIYAGETFFYREIAGKYGTRTPHCYFAEVDNEGNSVLVLEDLEAKGVRFIEPTEAQSPDTIANGLESVARYQAASWNSAELKRNDYLLNGGFWGVGNVLDWMYNAEHWQDYSKRPRFQALAPELRDRELLLNAHRRVKNDWWTYGPLVLAHGDAHVGQLYQMPDGDVRLLDWQCVRLAHWGFDPSNILVSGLSIEDRRHHARDLLHHYVTKLSEFGVAHPPTVDDAFYAMRAYTIHGLGWVMCMVEMQPEENCTAITERASAAALDLDTIATIMAGPQALSIR